MKNETRRNGRASKVEDASRRPSTRKVRGLRQNVKSGSQNWGKASLIGLLEALLRQGRNPTTTGGLVFNL